MQIQYPSPNKGIYNALIWCLTIPMFCVLLSCGTSPSIQVIGNESDSTPTRPRHIIFKGDDYMVCKLKGDETAASLAKIYLGGSKKAWIIEDANGRNTFKKGQVVIIPVRLKNIGGIAANGYQTVPVLGYYGIEKKCGASHCVPSHIFDQQMKYLKDKGYRVISMVDLLGFLYYQRAVPEKSVAVTIEDSRVSIYHTAVPILKKYGFNATFFINVDLIDKDKTAMTWAQVKELKANGFAVGSLALSNDDFKGKKDNEDEQSYMARIKTTLLHSKEVIDKKLSQNTVYIALPSDEHNAFLLNICDQIGYKIALSTRQGSNPFFEDPLALKRNLILDPDMEIFITKLKTFQKSPLR